MRYRKCQTGNIPRRARSIERADNAVPNGDTVERGEWRRMEGGRRRRVLVSEVHASMQNLLNGRSILET